MMVISLLVIPLPSGAQNGPFEFATMDLDHFDQESNTGNHSAGFTARTVMISRRFLWNLMLPSAVSFNVL